MERLRKAQTKRLWSVVNHGVASIHVLGNLSVGSNREFVESLLEEEEKFIGIFDNKDSSYYQGVKYEEAKERLGILIRTICRNLHVDRSGIESAPEADDNLLVKVAVSLSELNDYISKTLSKTSEQQDVTIQHQRKVMERAEAAQMRADRLSTELCDIQNAHDEAMKRKTQQTYSLEAEIGLLKVNIVKEEQSIQAQSKTTLEDNQTLYHKLTEKRGTETKVADEEYSALREESEAAELALYKKIKKATNKVNQIKQRYDRDMTQKSGVYRKMKRQYKDECKRLEDLEDYYRKIDKDIDNQREEERLIAQAQAQIDAQQAELDRAAARIQSRLRGNMIRRKLKSKGKKKGKKGKGKKTKK